MSKKELLANLAALREDYRNHKEDFSRDGIDAEEQKKLAAFEVLINTIDDKLQAMEEDAAGAGDGNAPTDPDDGSAATEQAAGGGASGGADGKSDVVQPVDRPADRLPSLRVPAVAAMGARRLSPAAQKVLQLPQRVGMRSRVRMRTDREACANLKTRRHVKVAGVAKL